MFTVLLDGVHRADIWNSWWMKSGICGKVLILRWLCIFVKAFSCFPSPLTRWCTVDCEGWVKR